MVIKYSSYVIVAVGASCPIHDPDQALQIHSPATFVMA